MFSSYAKLNTLYIIIFKYIFIILLYIYTATLIKISKKFKLRIIKGYLLDLLQNKVLITLYTKDSRSEDATKLLFILKKTIILNQKVLRNNVTEERRKLSVVPFSARYNQLGKEYTKSIVYSLFVLLENFIIFTIYIIVDF